LHLEGIPPLRLTGVPPEPFVSPELFAGYYLQNNHAELNRAPFAPALGQRSGFDPALKSRSILSRAFLEQAFSNAGVLFHFVKCFLNACTVRAVLFRTRIAVSSSAFSDLFSRRRSKFSIHAVSALR